jgi:hypothetical protein
MNFTNKEFEKIYLKLIMESDEGVQFKYICKSCNTGFTDENGVAEGDACPVDSCEGGKVEKFIADDIDPDNMPTAYEANTEENDDADCDLQDDDGEFEGLFNEEDELQDDDLQDDDLQDDDLQDEDFEEDEFQDDDLQDDDLQDDDLQDDDLQDEDFEEDEFQDDDLQDDDLQDDDLQDDDLQDEDFEEDEFQDDDLQDEDADDEAA